LSAFRVEGIRRGGSVYNSWPPGMEGILRDATVVVLSDVGSTYGVRRSKVGMVSQPSACFYNAVTGIVCDNTILRLTEVLASQVRLNNRSSERRFRRVPCNPQMASTVNRTADVSGTTKT
jgi:hypothetical protein